MITFEILLFAFTAMQFDPTPTTIGLFKEIFDEFCRQGLEEYENWLRLQAWKKRESERLIAYAARALSRGKCPDFADRGLSPEMITAAFSGAFNGYALDEGWLYRMNDRLVGVNGVSLILKRAIVPRIGVGLYFDELGPELFPAACLYLVNRRTGQRRPVILSSSPVPVIFPNSFRSPHGEMTAYTIVEDSDGGRSKERIRSICPSNSFDLPQFS